jgi:hypothetical protein
LYVNERDINLGESIEGLIQGNHKRLRETSTKAGQFRHLDLCDVETLAIWASWKNDIPYSKGLAAIKSLSLQHKDNPLNPVHVFRPQWVCRERKGVHSQHSIIGNYERVEASDKTVYTFPVPEDVIRYTQKQLVHTDFLRSDLPSFGADKSRFLCREFDAILADCEWRRSMVPAMDYDLLVREIKDVTNGEIPQKTFKCIAKAKELKLPVIPTVAELSCLPKEDLGARREAEDFFDAVIGKGTPYDDVDGAGAGSGSASKKRKGENGESDEKSVPKKETPRTSSRKKKQSSKSKASKDEA